MWVGLIQSVEGLKRKRLRSPKEEGLLFFLFFRFLFFLLYLIYNVLSISAVQQSDPAMCVHAHIHTHTFFFSHYPPSCSSKSGQVQFLVLHQDLIAYPLQMQWFAPTNPKLPIHPTPSLSLLATRSLFSKSMSLFLFCRKFQLCLILDSEYK